MKCVIKTANKQNNYLVGKYARTLIIGDSLLRDVNISLPRARRETVSFVEQIMSKDKSTTCASIFTRQMNTVVVIFRKLFL